MTMSNSFAGVREADVAQTLHVPAASVAAAHPAAAAAITPRKPRTGTAIVASVRGTPEQSPQKPNGHGPEITGSVAIVFGRSPNTGSLIHRKQTEEINDQGSRESEPCPQR